MKEASVDLFGCVKYFFCLKAWDRVLIATDPDIRKADFLCKTRVIHNWPAKCSSRFPQGYIAFENETKFDLKNQTINGQRVYIFECNEINEVYFQKRLVIKKIVELFKAVSEKDWKPAADLV
jgi:hypothetical protein